LLMMISRAYVERSSAAVNIWYWIKCVQLSFLIQNLLFFQLYDLLDMHVWLVSYWL
jgi:hypothetical protein